MNPHRLLHIALHGEPDDAIHAIHELREFIETTQHDHVLTLRQNGASWTHIARQIGVTRQAVSEKYGPWDPQKL